MQQSLFQELNAHNALLAILFPVDAINAILKHALIARQICKLHFAQNARTPHKFKA